MARRVVITGLGVVCSVGHDVGQFARSLKEGACGAGRIGAFDPARLAGALACEVRDFDAAARLGGRAAIRRMDRGARFLLAAAREALGQAGLPPGAVEGERAGVALGTTVGGAIKAAEYYEKRRATGHAYLSRLGDSPLYSAGYRVCVEQGWTGPNVAFSTACSSANMALGYALDLIRAGEVDVMLAGGFDALARITVAGFNVMRNVSPDRCTPFDRNRRGLVLGEGAGALILEAEEHARARGAEPLAELLGYGASSDAHHMTAPDATARGPALAMERALRDAGLTPDMVDYVNAHGTGTAHNDAVEAKAIRRVFGEHAGTLAVASTKAMHGHALGATGAIEAVSVVLSIRDGFIPPTLGFVEGDAESAGLGVSAAMRRRPVAVALSNNLGFGGNNCTVAIGRPRHGA